MAWLFSARLGIALLGALALPARAFAADSGAGKRLTEQWCTGCHVVGAGNQGTDAAPALPVIAQGKGKDQQWVRAWLTSPHPPMPNLNLSRQQIDDIVAYLTGLAQK